MVSGFLTFMDRYRDEAACIAALAELRWPNGFICAGCAGRLAYQLTCRPRVFECAGCGRQHSVTAGTVFHRTRTPLRKWFAAAWLIGQDKRGVSALFLARELALRYDTAWLMAHKLRHALSERPEFPLDGLLEIDESYYGGRGKRESRGRGLTDPNKSLMAIAVETIPAAPRQGEGIKKSRFVAGSARIAVLRPPPRRIWAILSATRPSPAPASSPMVSRATTLWPTASAITRSSKTAAKTPIPCCPSSTSCSATSRLGSTAPFTASALSTCPATRASGTTASIAAVASPISPTSCSGELPPGQPSPTASSSMALKSTEPTYSNRIGRCR